MAALGVLALFLIQLLVISMVMAPRQDLGTILEDVDPLWAEHEDSVKNLEEKFELLQNQLTLVESRETANSRVMLEKLDQFENSLLALGIKVDRGVDSTVTGDKITLIAEEIKDLKMRVVDAEKREQESGGSGETVGGMVPSMVDLVKELARDVARETVDNQMRGEVGSQISNHLQNLESKNTDLKEEMKTFAQEMVNERLSEKLEEARSIERKEKEEVMNRIKRMEEMASTLPKDDNTSSGVREALLEDWASEEAGGRVVENSIGYLPASLPTLTVFGVPIWWSSNLPSLALRTGNLPGQCWAMEGSQGYLLVKLGAAIHISGVSFQLGRAVKDPSSAPRLVSVSADPYFEPILNASLPRRASEVVTFMLPHATSTTHSLVKIEILDNHGHPSYTCLHRVMVHGSIAKEVTEAGLDEEEKRVMDSGLEEEDEGVRVVNGNPLGRDSQQCEL